MLARDLLNREAALKLQRLGESLDPQNLPLLTLAELALERSQGGIDPAEAEEMEPLLSRLRERAGKAPEAVMKLLFRDEDGSLSPPPKAFREMSPPEAMRAVVRRISDRLRTTLEGYPSQSPQLGPPIL